MSARGVVSIGNSDDKDEAEQGTNDMYHTMHIP